MWILRYKYGLEDGTVRNVSCCLESGQTYSIGRSSKSLFNIKNDKSISRNHISLIWQPEGGGITISNQGKLTAAGGRYLKVGEEMIFEDAMFHDKPIIMELGTKPVKIEISWQKAVWDIPQRFATFKEDFSKFGIELLVEMADTRSTMMIVSEGQAHRSLFGVVHDIPLRNPLYLQNLDQVLRKSDTSFDESWGKLNRDELTMACPNGRIKQLVFGGLKFYLTVRNEQVIRYIKKAILEGGGEFMCVESLKDLLSCLKSEDSTKNVVVIQLPGSNVDVSQAGITAYSLEDVIRRIQDGSTTELLGGASHLKRLDQPTDTLKTTIREEPTSSRPLSEDPIQDMEKRPTKKRRLNRRTVKPLDSLMFFAGGDSFKSEGASDLSLPPPKVQESLVLSPPVTTVKHAEPIVETENVSPVKERAFNDGDSTKSHNSPAARSIKSFHLGVNSSNTESDVSAKITHLQKTKKVDEHDKVSIQSDPVHDVGRVLNKRAPKRQRTLRDSSPAGDENEATTTREELVEVIKDAKNREVKRLNSTLIQVNSDELTDDAINRLGRLAIVQPNEKLLRKQKSHNVEQAEGDHKPWYGRKNFKNFLKIQPKYKKVSLGDKYREGSSDFIRSSAFLLTREYVPLKPYSKEPRSTAEDFPSIAKELPANRTAADRSEDYSIQQHDSNGPSPAQELFVVDEDESQNAPLMVPEEQSLSYKEPDTSEVSRTTHSLRSTVSGKRKGTSGLIAERPSSSNGGNLATGDDDDDDDDYDDDEPKFKFRRHMR